MTDNFNIKYLLDRIYDNLNHLNTKNKVNLPKLQIVIENRKTFFSNFSKLCAELNRNENDFIKFLQNELASSTSINANNQLIIEGVFREKQMEKIIIRYIENYVKCKMCKSLQTIFTKDQRINMILCNKCNASYSVHIDK